MLGKSTYDVPLIMHNHYPVTCDFRYFQWAFDLLILVNAVFIGLSLDDAEWFFLAVFVIEIILRVYANGPRKYFSGFWNM